MAIAVASMVGVGAGCSGSGDDGRSRDPAGGSSTTALALPDVTGLPAPEPDTANAVQGYLGAEGQALLAMEGEAVRLLSGPIDPERCRTVAAQLNEGPSPAEVSDLVAGVPDDVLRDAYGALRSALQGLLSRCIEGEAPTDDESQLLDALAVAAARRSELGA